MQNNFTSIGQIGHSGWSKNGKIRWKSSIISVLLCTKSFKIPFLHFEITCI